MKVLMFGARGRLGTICGAELERRAPGSTRFEHQRDGSFLRSVGGRRESLRLRPAELAALARSEPLVFVDCSVDHRSTDALRHHEAEKAELCEQLDRASLLACAIGFGSGIAQLPAQRIRADHPHMLAYRDVKLRQMELYARLRCPSFLPSIFTLVGPLTYARQAAAWASILAERARASADTLVHDPLTRRFWVDESTVARNLAAFLAAEHPASVSGPAVDGCFCLDDVARVPLAAGLPELRYRSGSSDSWCIGDYVCDLQAPLAGCLAASLDAALAAPSPAPTHAHHL
ncbi:hypothetical protein [Thiomonas sp.]|uniref:hypothetical protein n=1 Tax=Thiomonas sp. TaxID=2047785 RepID=UPI0026033C6E|nr:hypothetical protein [Thiomonas sp.]